MSRRLLLALATFVTMLLAAPPAAAQQEGPEQLRVFLDCAACDFDFVRTEITYVDWMRDRADADLVVLARSQATGGGGREHTLDFIGVGRHAGKGDTLTYVAGRDDTQDVTRRGLSRVLQLGMVRYLVGTPAAERMQVTIAPVPRTGPAAAPAAVARDPWNAWVFSVGGNGNTSGESVRSNTNISANFGANRTTAAWKMNYSVRGSYGRQRVTFGLAGGTRDTTVVSLTRSYNGSGLVVRSVNGHASFGAQLNTGTSTFGNTDFFINLEPAVEYNLFPYSESTRRQLTVRYGAGFMSQAYREETIYFLMEETRGIHSLAVNYSTRQAWGNMNLGVNGQQYFHDTSLYNLVFSGGGSVNIVRGLSLNLGGNYAMVRDQISLPRRNLSPEEVLLRQRQSATSYRYFSNVGLSYRFGSPLQNVVNPRFGGGGGGGMTVMMF